MEHEKYDSAGDLINDTIANAGSSSEILSGLNEGKERLEASERATVEYYIGAMRPIYAGMIVDEFSGNTAGLYDGSDIYVDQSVMMVGQSVDTTIAQAQEVYDHEKYHQDNNHLATMEIVADARSGVAAVIGGVEFDQTALIEGLTVLETGDRFVSQKYAGYERTLEKAVSASGQTIGDVKHAVNRAKDLTLIDDRSRNSVLAT